MQLDLLIVDNFYNNPLGVRTFALNQEFSITGNFPGKRTQSFLTEDVKRAIQHWMIPLGMVTNWYDGSYSGAFQLTTCNDRSWIHSDYNTMWAGVCYLTPDAPLSAGTGLFKHKATGNYSKVTTDYESSDVTKWELADRIGNKFNRLIIYNSNLFHSSLDYFGDSDESGRLFQVFFFDTEKQS